MQALQQVLPYADECYSLATEYFTIKYPHLKNTVEQLFD